MRNFWKIMLIAIVSMAVASCGKDDPINPNPPSPTPDKLVMVELTLAAEDMPKVRAMDENVIKDVNVYLYGKMDYHFYFPTVAAALAFETLPGDYQMYVVTNVHKDMGSLTKAELETYVVAYDAMVDDIPMTANVAVKISSSSGTFALPEIQVKRNAAKIGYAIEVSDAVAATIKLQSVQFCNIPKSASLFGTAAASTSKSDYYDSPVINIADAKSYADVFYMFENLQGTVSSITDQKDKAPANAPACASYMKIYAQGVSKVVEYIVYLGENSTSDFNVRKNTKHTMDLVISGENEIDNRVRVYEGVYYGKANCYIVQPSQTTCEVDITPFLSNNKYEPTGFAAVDAIKPQTAVVLWSENSSAPSVILNLVSNKLVISGVKTGNTVVAIKDNLGVILWSYHIWKPEIDPTQTLTYLKAETHQWQGVKSVRLEAMPLALGAVNTATTSSTDAEKSKSCGLRYQWGRKDPLGRRDLSASFVYFKTTPLIDWDSQFSPGNQGISYAHAHPTTYMQYYSYEPKTGYSNTLLWGKKKTIFDPCPEGYRVMETVIYHPLHFEFNNTVNALGDFNKGWDFFYHDDKAAVDFWPATRQNNAGYYGYYWCCDLAPFGRNPVYLHFSQDRHSLSVYEGGIASGANSLRCVRL